MAVATDKKALDSALAAVDANLKTAAGKQYDERIGQEFSEKYLSQWKRCKQTVPQGTRTEAFDMFLRLNANGMVQEVLVYPETQFSSCSRAALLTAKFSNPPHDVYWINIHLQAK
jgi:hypothetical protein